MLASDGEDEDWDFGTGAGFYLDAEKAPWAQNYKMYSYITKELIDIIDNNFDININKIGIFGHSMGGHGALTIFLKNQNIFKSSFCFCAHMQSNGMPLGEKSVYQLPWNRNRSMEELRCMRTRSYDPHKCRNPC